MKRGKNFNSYFFISVLLILLFEKINAQTLYQLKLNDTSTYKITCGTINPGIWAVNNSNCSLTTSNIILPPTPSSQTIDVNVTIEGSNMENADTATIEYSVNGKWKNQKVIQGKPGTFTTQHSFNIAANANDTICILINFFNDKGNEYWRMFDGKIIAKKDAPLPIELLSFEGQKNENGIELSWSSASETNNNFYTLKKSSDGISFQTLATISGAGNSTSVKKYSCRDNDPGKGKNYYLLAQTDFDGKEKNCSSIIELNFLNEPSFNLYPNPAINGEAYLHFDSDVQNEFLIIINDNTGRFISSKNIHLQKKENEIPLSVFISDLLPGIYFVSAKNSNESFQKKMVIK